MVSTGTSSFLWAATAAVYSIGAVPAAQAQLVGQGVGSAIMTICEDNDNVQASTFDWRSGKTTNTGNKRISAIFMNLANAIIPDLIFDSDGTGGDDVSKYMSHDWGTTETNPVDVRTYNWQVAPMRSRDFQGAAPFDPNNLGDVDNLFVDELSDSGLGCAGGYRGALMAFGDFDEGEEWEFSIDVDPNSLAGLNQGTVNNHASWDVGGVSGAEMIGSTITVLFGDGTSERGTVAADGSQGGGVAVVGPDIVAAPKLTVGSLEDGDSGPYTASPEVEVSGTAGDVIRVTRMSAFNPGDNQKGLANGAITAEALMTARLWAQSTEFPYTNAKKLQHVEVTLPESGKSVVEFTSEEDDVGAAYTAVQLDENGLPMSFTSDPIRLSSPPGNSSEDPVENGSFEDNSADLAPGECAFVPSWRVDTWASTSGDLKLCASGGNMTAPDGSTVLVLDDSSDGQEDGIYQTLTTEEGRLYKLSFQVLTSDPTDMGTAIKVEWKGLDIYNEYHPPTADEWGEVVVILEGSYKEENLAIKESSPSTGADPYIDNIKLTPL